MPSSRDPFLFTSALFIVTFVALSAASESTNKCSKADDGGCDHADDEHAKMKYTKAPQNIEEEIRGPNGRDNRERLVRRDGVKIGHVEKVKIGENRTVEVITKSFRPLLFEIPGFLTDEECDHIINRAKNPNEGGMFMSKAKGGLTPNVTYQRKGVNGKSTGILKDFGTWDCIVGDRLVTVEEVINAIHRAIAIILSHNDVIKMFDVLGEKEIFEDGYMDEKEFSDLSTLEVEFYVDELWQNDARFKTRASQQAWLFMESWVDPTIHKIRERLMRLTGLPRRIIYGGEQLQVVHYYPNGHYHAHHDSETHRRTDIPCCHQYKGDTLESTGECKLCRFVTFIMYLNDVEEGGETAFPMADSQHGYDEDEIRGNATSDKYNLSHGCKHSNLLLKPKKGMAALWYNHLLNETDSWMGELDLYSLHGGCDVVKGEKWLSNMWIPGPFGRAHDVESIYFNERDYKLAEKEAQSTKL